LSNEKADYVFKIVLIGDPAVGKTSLIQKYTLGKFEKKYVKTIGAQFSQYSESIEGNKINLFIWDIAGQDDFSLMRPTFYRGAKGVILVYSLIDDESFKSLKTWYDDIKKHCGDLPVALFGNKVDLVNEKKLEDSKVDSLKGDFDFIGHYYTSAKTGKNVLDAFQSLVKVIYKS
jgi:small GTP-binding protein